MEEKIEVLTIGHSTMPSDKFIYNLKSACVNAVADVRTSPFSGRFPQYNSNNIKEELRRNEITYVFLGKQLGGRPARKEFYCDGVADYEKMAADPNFLMGIERVIEGARKYRIALMCSEHNPLDCHRCLLVGRALVKRKVSVSHILYSGRLASHEEVERKLVELSEGSNNKDFFKSNEMLLDEAYRRRSKKVAFQEPVLAESPEGI